MTALGGGRDPARAFPGEVTREYAVEQIRRLLARRADDVLGEDVSAEAYGAFLGGVAAHPLADVLRLMLDGAPDLRSRFNPVFAAVVLHGITWVDVIAAELTLALLEDAS